METRQALKVKNPSGSNGNATVSRYIVPAIFALSAAALLINIGTPSLWGSEGRWAVISRYMFRSLDIFNPMLGNYPYWDKPLMSYWQILPFGFLSGDVTTDVSRMPSAIWALTLLWLTYSTAALLSGKKTAMYACLALAGSYGFMFWGRNAQIEMANAGVIMLCLWYFLKHKNDANKRWLFVLAFIAAMGANLKGLPAVGVPVLSIFIASCVTKDWKWFPKVSQLFPLALFTFTVFLFIPFLACITTNTWEPLRMVWHENVIRFFTPFDHKDPVYVYFIRIFDLFAPWSILLPASLIYWLSKSRFKDSGIKTMLLYFAGIFLFFTLSGSRRSYYILPALPFASMIVGAYVASLDESITAKGYKIYFQAFSMLISIALIAPVFVLIIKPELLPVDATGLLPWAAVLFALGVCVFYGCIKLKPALVMTTALIVWVVYSAGIIPFISELPGNLKSEVSKLKLENRPVSYLASDDAKIMFYLDKPYEVFQDNKSAKIWAGLYNGIILAHDEISEPGWIKLYDVGNCIAYETGEK